MRDSMMKPTVSLKALSARLERNRLGEILVQQRHITPAQLREALSIQKSNPLPLGRVLVQHGMVTTSTIYTAIFSQWALRGVAACLSALIVLLSFPMTQAHANSGRDVPATLVLASAAPVEGLSQYPTLWNSGERRSKDLSAFTKWNGMFARFSQESRAPSFQKAAASWKDEIYHLQGKPLEVMAREVNNFANNIRYIEDSDNYGRSDYWATPLEFFSRGGDCEDYAIAKYSLLRALGVPDSRMRVSIVKDLQKNIPHAVLIVYTESGPMLLDNQIKRMTNANHVDHYRPIFSINANSWWLHTPPRPATVIASR